MTNTNVTANTNSPKFGGSTVSPPKTQDRFSAEVARKRAASNDGNAFRTI